MKTRRTSAFTFIEMLVVCVIVLLASVLVIPRITVSSKRMIVETALSDLRGAFSETAMRARAGGHPLALVLKTDEKVLVVEKLTNDLDHDWRPAPLTPVNSSGTTIIPGTSSYKVPEKIEWTELPDVPSDAPGIVYGFYPDGAATGPAVSFTIQERNFRLVIDSVLGKATILEEEQ